MTAKTKSKKNHVSLQKADQPSLIEMITRFWVTLLVILIIVYAAILMTSRTDGFKGLVRQRLEAITEIPLSIERVHVSPALDLIIEGIRENAETNSIVRLEIKQAELYWKFIPLLRGSGWPFKVLKLDGCSVRFTRDKGGSWSPLPKVNDSIAPWVAGVSDFEGEAVTTNSVNVSVTEYLRQVRAKIEIRNLELEWIDSGNPDVPKAMVQGVAFDCEAVRPMDETVLWCRLKIDRAVSSGSVWLGSLELEWIRLHDQDVVLRTGTTARDAR